MALLAPKTSPDKNDAYGSGIAPFTLPIKKFLKFNIPVIASDQGERGNPIVPEIASSLSAPRNDRLWQLRLTAKLVFNSFIAKQDWQKY